VKIFNFHSFYPEYHDIFYNGIRFFGKHPILLRQTVANKGTQTYLNPNSTMHARLSLQSFVIIFFLFFSSAAFASVEVVGSLKQSFAVNPGESIKSTIRIQNSDSTQQEVRIYQTDLLYNFQDQTFYDEPGTNRRSNATWIDYSPKTVVLAAKESRNIEIEIKIPASDTLKGTYWSIIMVEGVSPINPNQTGDLSIRTVTRYAVQMITEMNVKGLGSLRFMPPTLLQTEEQAVFLAVDLENNGEHYISPELKMELYDENGELVKTIVMPKKGLYPFTSTRFRLNLEGVPSKKTYNAMIVAAGQDEDVFGLEYTLYF